MYLHRALAPPLVSNHIGTITQYPGRRIQAVRENQNAVGLARERHAPLTAENVTRQPACMALWACYILTAFPGVDGHARPSDADA
ncbi:hypothetical protein VTJ49DRAFT_6585 [Mycothermus thermophilus]|uniref:Uncharacterized protein n=1 Tax=Humicola insolens TaxID=85995 RepID=A0ABR3V274_HUMIN